MPTDDPEPERGGIDRRDLFRVLGIGGLSAAGIAGLAGGTTGQQQLELEYITMVSEATGEQATDFADAQGNVACVLVGLDAGAQVVDPPHPVAYQVVVVHRRADGTPDVVVDVFEEASTCFAGMIDLDRGGQAELQECFGVAGLGPAGGDGAANDYEVFVIVTDLVAATCAMASKQFTVSAGEAGPTGNETAAATATGNATAGNETT